MPLAIAFDMDGTLVDSVDLHAEAWHEALKHFGHDIPTEKIRSQIGKGGDKLLPAFLPKEEVETKSEEIEKYRGKLFEKDYLHRVKPFPKVRELFERIKADGKQIALASSSDKKQLKKLKEIADITDLVDCETSADDVERSKPDPDIFHVVLQRLEPIQAKDLIMVGDTPYDASGAARAGVRTVGVLCGGFEESGLKAAGCVAIYRDPADLLENYERSPLA